METVVLEKEDEITGDMQFRDENGNEYRVIFWEQSIQPLRDLNYSCLDKKLKHYCIANNLSWSEVINDQDDEYEEIDEYNELNAFNDQAIARLIQEETHEYWLIEDIKKVRKIEEITDHIDQIYNNIYLNRLSIFTIKNSKDFEEQEDIIQRNIFDLMQFIKDLELECKPYYIDFLRQNKWAQHMVDVFDNPFFKNCPVWDRLCKN